jgi:hypothetical protein
MLSLRTVRASLVRFAVVGSIAASLVAALPGAANADDQGARAASEAATMLVQICEAMGGTAEVTTIMTANGRYTVEVQCEGGYLGGVDCIYDADYAGWCKSSGRLEVDPDTTVSVLTPDIKPLEEEPTDQPVDNGAVSQPVDTTDGGDVAPEPTPIIDIDPVIEEPVVSDGEALPDPTPEPTETVDLGLESPLGDDAEVAPETDSGSGDDIIIDNGSIGDEMPVIG